MALVVVLICVGAKTFCEDRVGLLTRLTTLTHCLQSHRAHSHDTLSPSIFPVLFFSVVAAQSWAYLLFVLVIATCVFDEKVSLLNSIDVFPQMCPNIFNISSYLKTRKGHRRVPK